MRRLAVRMARGVYSDRHCILVEYVDVVAAAAAAAALLATVLAVGMATVTFATRTTLVDLSLAPPGCSTVVLTGVVRTVSTGRQH